MSQVTESRVKKTFLNARVNLIFYFLNLVLSFFSRKIFLDSLGADFIGLTGTLYNLLGFLNIVELGIGTAIGYVLYKPLYDKDQSQINEIISVFGYLYRWVGIIILVAGVVLSLFLPLIFANITISMPVVFAAFYSFLATSLIGYFINYKQTLLSADQRNYVVTAYFQTANILKIIIQLVSAYYTHNYYLWIVIELFFGIIYTFILNWKINQVYPWLKSDVRSGRELLKKYPRIMVLVKQVFAHKIGTFVQFQLSPFLIYTFASLQSVAYYGNYTLLTSKLSGLFGNFLGSSSAGVGNLIAEGNKEKIMRIYWELLSIRFLFAGISAVFLYYIIPPFITLWLGSEYVMSQGVLILVILSFVLGILRGTTDEFINGHGLYHDVWAPLVESAIFVVIAIVGGFLCGLEGVLLGGIVSLLAIVFGWKPYFLFRHALHIPIRVYVLGFSKHLLCVVVGGVLFALLHDWLHLPSPTTSWFTLIVYSAAVGAALVVLQFIALYVGSRGMRDFIARFLVKP